MISVVIPTQGIEQPVVATLAALVPGAAAGIVRDVVLVDRPGSEVVERVADFAGCQYLNSTDPAPRRSQPARAKPVRPGSCFFPQAQYWIQDGSMRPRNSCKASRIVAGNVQAFFVMPVRLTRE